MKIWQKMIAPFRRSLSLTVESGWSSPSMASEAGESVSASTVLGLSAVWACVNLLAGTIASLPLMVYRTDERGSRSVAKDHPLYRVLHDSPNADQTALDFWEYEVAGVELWGNGYARLSKGTDDRIIALTPVRPDIMAVDRLVSGGLRYKWSENGKSYEVGEGEILHIRGFGGDPLGGMSTLAFARNSFGLARAIDRAAGAMFKNGLKPSGILALQQWLTDEQRTVVEEKLAEKFAGAMNAGRPFIAEGGMTWSPLTINPDDAQMLESRGFSVEEICRFFGVPPFMVGHTEKSTSWGTGIEQQTLAFQKFTLRRRLKRIEQAVEKQLLTPADRAAGITVEFNLEGLLRGDSAARSTFYASALNNGWMTINEVRALENMPPVAGGETPRMQMQNVPITEAGKAPAPGRNSNEDV